MPARQFGRDVAQAVVCVAGSSWNALKIQDFPVLDLAGRVTTPPCGTEDGSRRKECNLRNQRMAVRFILNRTGKSKTEILVEKRPARRLPRPGMSVRVGQRRAVYS